MSKNIYNKLFATRVIWCFIVIMLLMLSAILRVVVVATSNYNTIALNQSLYRINVARIRGTIFDCNMVPLTNSTSRRIAAIAPTPNGIMTAHKILSGEELNNTLNILKNNMPAICTVTDSVSTDSVSTTLVYNQTDSNQSASHIIGYTDATGHGISGLQLAYDDLLYSDKYVSAVFTSDGKGNILGGVSPYFENNTTDVLSGVVATIDINVQNVVETAASKMNSGCVVVAEMPYGKIRALASVPDFDINDISASLNAENSPMLNRALLCYNVGSVFKPCVAVAALENGYNTHTFNCEGRLKIVDRDFRCHKLAGHGVMNLQSSLAQSCNCFFYDFAITIGGENIYKTARYLSIGSEIRIADNLYTAAGNLPDVNSLTNYGALANLSIGQGNLMASPVSMLNLYMAIAGDGSYYLPSVVEKTIKDGVINEYNIQNPTRVMNADTAALLRKHLKTVITDGTGAEAEPDLCTAAGKTATAQTGRYYENGEEITNSWFCGFFPADQPQYVVVVMSDSKSAVSTASVFAEIADEITDLYN